MGKRKDGEPRSKLVVSRDKADDAAREARLEAHRLRVEQEMAEAEENSSAEDRAELKRQRESSARAKKAVAESVRKRKEAKEALLQDSAAQEV